jgi:2-keto-4-pentenoate hydratase
MTTSHELAASLVQWHDERRPFVPFAKQAGIANLKAAYDVQDTFVAHCRQRRHSQALGYKVGLTSPRMQAMCGIDTPVAGVVLAADVHPSSASIPLGNYVHLGIEFEIGVRMGRDLDAGQLPTSLAEMAEAVDAVCPAVELVDDRNADYKNFDVLSGVADNAWNAGAVLGEFHTEWPDLAEVKMTVERNGEVIDSGYGRDILGHPFEPLLWLTRHLAGRGQAIRRGDVVLTGSVVPTRFPSPGETYRVSLDGLGDVTLNLTA